MKWILDALLAKIKEYNPEMNEAQLNTRRFGLESMLNEISKFIIYLIIFSVFHLTGLYLLAFITFCSIRAVTGGYHAKSYTSCLVTSFVLIAAPVLAGKYLYLGIIAMVGIALFSLTVTVIFAPVLHKNTPRKNIKNRSKFKLYSILFVSLWLGVSFLLPSQMAVTVAISVLAVAILEILGKFYNQIMGDIIVQSSTQTQSQTQSQSQA